MDPDWVKLLVVISAFCLMLIGVPVALSLAAMGFMGYCLLGGLGPALHVMGIIPFGSVAMYSLTVIPLFIFMGNLAHYAGFGTDIFRAARTWMGGIPGGLAQATIAGCTAFGAVSGSGLATCAMMAKIAIPEMIKNGYDLRLAIGTVASAGPIAQMIPPSILFVIYAIITEQSVGKLLMAGILPGILESLIFMVTVYILVKRDPKRAPIIKGTILKDKIKALRGAWTVGLLAIIIIGGIYSGIFTPTEAGGVAAFSTLLLGLLLGRLKGNLIWMSLKDSIGVTGMIFFIQVGAFIFGTFLAISQIPPKIAQFVTTLAYPPLVILIIIMIVYLILGCLIDNIANLFLTLPITVPIIKSLGYDPIWFGVLIVLHCETALITPPYGLNLFLIKGILKDVTMKDILIGVFPFVFANMVTMAVLIAFPQIALYIPNKMD
jgi:tripartite ATP-independent transporter DctM subunit